MVKITNKEEAKEFLRAIPEEYPEHIRQAGKDLADISEAVDKLELMTAKEESPDYYRDYFTDRELEGLLAVIKQSNFEIDLNYLLNEAEGVAGITWNKIVFLFDSARDRDPQKYGSDLNNPEALLEAYCRFIDDFLNIVFKKELAELRELRRKEAHNVIVSESLSRTFEGIPAMPNTAFYNLFFKALTAPQHIKSGHIGNNKEGVRVDVSEKDITITRTVRDANGKVKETNIIKVANIRYNKKNGSTIKIFSYIFQKLASMQGYKSVHVSYEELVNIGIFNSLDAARRGVNSFYDFFHGYTDEKKEQYFPGVSISGKVKTKNKKDKLQIERDLIIGRDIKEGGQTIYFSDEVDLTLFTSFTSYLPLWVYQLKDLNAFLLVRYIFYIARMQGTNIDEPEKADQDPKHPYKVFNISFDAIRDNLGLPTPQEVPNRKYNEYIKKPIDRAIEEIEKAIAEINDPSKSVLMRLTPLGILGASNIDEYLRCKLSVGIVSNFADYFIKASIEHDQKVKAFLEKVETEKAKRV